MLKKVLSPLADHAYALLRIVAGFMFTFPGFQKLFGVLWTHPKPQIGTQLWFGGVIELVAGFLIGIGLLTRWAAFLSSGTMAVAYIQYHWKFQGGSQLLPSVNGGAPALLFAWLFLFIACRGAGPWSVDARLEREPKRDA